MRCVYIDTDLALQERSSKGFALAFVCLLSRDLGFWFRMKMSCVS